MRQLQLADPGAVAEIDRYLEHYWPAYQGGHLLTRGGIGDQPARYLEMIAAVREMQSDVDAKYHEITAPKEET